MTVFNAELMAVVCQKIAAMHNLDIDKVTPSETAPLLRAASDESQAKALYSLIDGLNNHEFGSPSDLRRSAMTLLSEIDHRASVLPGGQRKQLESVGRMLKNALATNYHSTFRQLLEDEKLESSVAPFLLKSADNIFSQEFLSSSEVTIGHSAAEPVLSKEDDFTVLMQQRSVKQTRESLLNHLDSLNLQSSIESRTKYASAFTRAVDNAIKAHSTNSEFVSKCQNLLDSVHNVLRTNCPQTWERLAAGGVLFESIQAEKATVAKIKEQYPCMPAIGRCLTCAVCCGPVTAWTALRQAFAIPCGLFTCEPCADDNDVRGCPPGFYRQEVFAPFTACCADDAYPERNTLTLHDVVCRQPAASLFRWGCVWPIKDLCTRASRIKAAEATARAAEVEFGYRRRPESALSSLTMYNRELSAVPPRAPAPSAPSVNAMN